MLDLMIDKTHDESRQGEALSRQQRMCMCMTGNFTLKAMAAR